MKTRLSLVALLMSFIVGCAGGGVDKSDNSSASALTKEELQQVLIDHTFPLSKGGMYFISETEATVSWDGQIEDATWYANDDSQFCYTVTLFGGEEECMGLMKTAAGGFVRDFEGNIKATDIKPGKTF